MRREIHLGRRAAGDDSRCAVCDGAVIFIDDGMDHLNLSNGIVVSARRLPANRLQMTALHREIMGRMIDLGMVCQTDLARHLGITQWTLNRHLRGRRANPTVLKKLEKFLRSTGRKARAA